MPKPTRRTVLKTTLQASAAASLLGAVTCGTIACVAGGDPEKMKQLPDTTGLKNECIVPKWSRSYYDQAVRNVGVRMVEVDTAEDLAAAFTPRPTCPCARAPSSSPAERRRQRPLGRRARVRGEQHPDAALPRRRRE